MIPDRALKSGIEIFTHRIFTHKEKKFQEKLFDYFDFAHHQHLTTFAVNHAVTKENSRKRMNELDKRGEYQKFCNKCLQMRESVIKSYAEQVIAHAALNGGSCHRGFVKDLVDGAAKVAPFMRITCNNIINKVRAIQGQGPNKCEQREVSPTPAIPFHVIRDPSISTNLDLSVSASSDAKSINEQDPLDILASQAVYNSVVVTKLSGVQTPLPITLRQASKPRRKSRKLHRNSVQNYYLDEHQKP